LLIKPTPFTVSILFDPDTDPDPDFIRFPLSFSFRRTFTLTVSATRLQGDEYRPV
jgi:hypothetical protein